MANIALDAYQKGTRAWFADKQEGWVSAELVERQARLAAHPRPRPETDCMAFLTDFRRGRQACF